MGVDRRVQVGAPHLKTARMAGRFGYNNCKFSTVPITAKDARCDQHLTSFSTSTALLRRQRLMSDHIIPQLALEFNTPPSQEKDTPSFLPMIIPHCNCPKQVQLTLRPGYTPEQRHTGVWYECPCQGYATLLPSEEICALYALHGKPLRRYWTERDRFSFKGCQEVAK